MAIMIPENVQTFKTEGERKLYNFLQNVAKCAAYYDLVYHTMKSANDMEAADAYLQHYWTAYSYSLMLANQGRSEEMAIEVTNARIELNIKRMRQETKNRIENISILINKYHDGCQEALENPPHELSQILKTKPMIQGGTDGISMMDNG